MLHAAAPEFSVNAHDPHDDDPAAALYVPTPHITHTLHDDAATDVEYVPAGHCEHDEAPVVEV